VGRGSSVSRRHTGPHADDQQPDVDVVGRLDPLEAGRKRQRFDRRQPVEDLGEVRERAPVVEPLERDEGEDDGEGAGEQRPRVAEEVRRRERLVGAGVGVVGDGRGRIELRAEPVEDREDAGNGEQRRDDGPLEEDQQGGGDERAECDAGVASDARPSPGRSRLPPTACTPLVEATRPPRDPFVAALAMKRYSFIHCYYIITVILSRVIDSYANGRHVVSGSSLIFVLEQNDPLLDLLIRLGDL